MVISLTSPTFVVESNCQVTDQSNIWSGKSCQVGKCVGLLNSPTFVDMAYVSGHWPIQHLLMWHMCQVTDQHLIWQVAQVLDQFNICWLADVSGHLPVQYLIWQVCQIQHMTWQVCQVIKQFNICEYGKLVRSLTIINICWCVMKVVPFVDIGVCEIIGQSNMCWY